MGYSPPHGRIKAKYNPRPNAAEREIERLLQEEPCFGCGGTTEELHHTMLEFPGKLFRRDHRFQLPLCCACHRGPKGVHGIGHEKTWLASIEKTAAEAVAYMMGFVRND